MSWSKWLVTRVWIGNILPLPTGAPLPYTLYIHLMLLHQKYTRDERKEPAHTVLAYGYAHPTLLRGEYSPFSASDLRLMLVYIFIF